jgi:hypothetical protein
VAEESPQLLPPVYVDDLAAAAPAVLRCGAVAERWPRWLPAQALRKELESFCPSSSAA